MTMPTTPKPPPDAWLVNPPVNIRPAEVRVPGEVFRPHCMPDRSPARFLTPFRAIHNHAHAPANGPPPKRETPAGPDWLPSPAGRSPADPGMPTVCLPGGMPAGGQNGKTGLPQKKTKKNCFFFACGA